MARWLTLAESGSFYDIEANASPILAAETLRRNLWNVAYGVLVTSATLTALGTFDRYRMRAGLPRNAVTAVVPSPFHHAEAGVLRVPDLKADPRNAAEHTAAIIRELPELVKGARGSLVLFSSRKQMQEVFDGLDRDWRKRVFIQGNLSKQETLNKHKSRVDDGEDSVLFGLASFAEGVDLPGAYCEHVVIAKIPFAVPDDPVEAALAEWIEARGGNPFMEIAVPDASLRLVQACGRLLRTEQDRGTITLLDRRVVTQRYRQGYPQCIAAVPPGNRLTRWPAREGASLHVRAASGIPGICPGRDGVKENRLHDPFALASSLLLGLLAVATPLAASDTQQVLFNFVKPMAVVGITLEDADLPSATAEATPEATFSVASPSARRNGPPCA